MLQVFVVGAVVIALLLMYAAHLYQKMKVEKARRIAELSYRYKVINGALTGIPPQFLSKDLTIFAINEAIQVLSLLKKEKPRELKVSLALNGKRQQLESIQESYQTPQKMALTGMQDARLVRARLVSLRNIITAKVNRKLLDPQEGKEFVGFINWQAIRLCDRYFIRSC